MSLVKEQISTYFNEGMVKKFEECEMDLATIFDRNEDLSKDTVRDAFLIAGMTGHISVETHADVQLILMRWETEQASNTERVSVIKLYESLNEMARAEENHSFEFVRTEEELMAPIKTAMTTEADV